MNVILNTDAYYNPEYGKIYETLEKGVCERFSYSDDNGTVDNIFIKRPVPYLVNGEQFFDIVTPYGYGGAHITELNGDADALLDAFWKAYTEYCKEQKIICEFVRFHPLVENALLWKDRYCYDVVFSRNTIAINTADKDFFANQFTPESRNKARKCLRDGARIEIDEDLKRLDDFFALYYKTMEKNNATDYYFFDKKYFEDIKNVFGKNIVLINAIMDEKVISSSMFFMSEHYMHYHLASTDPDYYRYGANNAILTAAGEYALSKGISWLHLGGGVSSAVDDPLFKFKHTFGRKDENLKEFYIGKCIFDKEIYGLLCEKAREHGVNHPDFFPEYR